MLKKAGIVVAAAAAGLLAVSPLAFAGESGNKGDHEGHRGSGHSVSDNQVNNVEGDSGSGLVNVSGNNVNVPIQACGNDVPINVLGVQVTDVVVDLTAALGVLGSGEAERDGQTGDSRNCAQDASGQDSNTQLNSD